MPIDAEAIGAEVPRPNVILGRQTVKVSTGKRTHRPSQPFSGQTLFVTANLAAEEDVELAFRDQHRYAAWFHRPAPCR